MYLSGKDNAIARVTHNCVADTGEEDHEEADSDMIRSFAYFLLLCSRFIKLFHFELLFALFGLLELFLWTF